MSKVVHLCDEAHKSAKEYCKSRGMRMSDWVASLITRAIAEEEAAKNRPPEPPPPKAKPTPRPVLQRERIHRYARAGVKKRILSQLETKPQMDQSGTPAWAAPPFWAQEKQ